jgi:hypothetical protein
MRTIRRVARLAPFALVLAACGGGDGATPPETPETPAELQATPTTLALSESQPAGSVFLTTKPSGRSLGWRVGSKPDWLTMSADSGTVKGTTAVTATLVVPADQDPGSMYGEIALVYPTGSVTVPVTAMVVASGRIVITPTSLAIAASRDTAELTLSNPGHGSVSWSASPSVQWLTIPTSRGLLRTGQSVVVQIVARRASIPPGTTTGSIGIFSGAEAVPVQIPVTVAVPPAP